MTWTDSSDGDDLTITWNASGGSLRKKDSSATFDSTGLRPGTYTITAEVSDGQYSATCTAEITIEKLKAAKK